MVFSRVDLLMKRIVTLILILTFLAFGLFFGSLNDAPVTVDYFFWQTTWPLAVNLMLFFLAGVVVSGLLVYLSMWVSLKRRIARLKKEQPDVKSSDKKELTLYD